ncbi:unnamed protein product [Somion occarium]|uniref:Cytochrome P450 n=1 Tax=Somion occarium TaxID=3059160 RepID=A0ABP1D8L2_9APHY
MSFATQFILSAVCLLVAVRLWLRKRTNIPRVGGPGPHGYIWTALRSVFDCNSVVEEGCRQFDGKPFVLPTLGGDMVVLGPDNVELLRKSDDSFNAPERAQQLFQINLQFGDFASNPYHLETILRSDLTKALKSLTPDLLEEAQLAIPETLGMKGSESVTVPLFDTMVNLLGRVSNRAMIGLPGCRDQRFLKQQVKLATTVISLAQFLNWFPEFLKPVIYKIVSLFIGGTRAVVPLLTPHLQSRIDYAQQDNPQTITDILLKFTPEEDIVNPERLAVRVAHLNMASIHTSAIFTTHALFELALFTPAQMKEIRDEITAAIDEEGGVCNKNAVGKMYKLDSLLKEIGRWHPLFAVGMSRVTLSDAVIADGTVIPKGSVVAIAPKVVHYSPEIYDHPEDFDPFRFSKMRQSAGGNESKHAFTALSSDYLLFGTGRVLHPTRLCVLADIMMKETCMSWKILCRSEDQSYLGRDTSELRCFLSTRQGRETEGDAFQPLHHSQSFREVDLHSEEMLSVWGFCRL